MMSSVHSSPLLAPGPMRVMGILNVTPDSFSDGGRWFRTEDALRKGMELVEDGAALVDVGGESTRPGASRVSADEEWDRIGAVVGGLAARGVQVSVDTVRAETARRAVGEGAVLVNDVSGGLHDPDMAATVAALGVPMVVQHWRGFPSSPDLNQVYGDVVRDVSAELLAQVDRVRAAGVPAGDIIIDPGLGFALNAQDSWTLVDHLSDLTELGYPVLVGASRKRFVAARYRGRLDQGTLDITVRAAAAGVWGVRVHDVEDSVRVSAGVGGGRK